MDKDLSSGAFAPPFTLRQLAYLVAAADAGTIAGAAERMHISASAMSDAITELERLIGTRLCVRRKAQGLTLTSAGTRVVTDARSLLRGAEDLFVALHSDGEELVGPLAVGCFSTLAPTILPPVLGDFASAHPRLDITVIEADQDRLVEMLDTGRIDMAFVYDVELPGRLRGAPLFALSPHVVLPKGHPLADAPVVRLAELIDEDFILLDAPPSRENALAAFSEQGLFPRIRHRTVNPEVVRTLVGRGLGYGMLVQKPAAGLPQDSVLVRKDVVPAIAPVVIEVIWSAENPPSVRAQALIDFAQTVSWPGPHTSS